MALQLGWDDFWQIYIENPERLQDEVDNLPEFLRGKSAKAQVEIVKFAPKTVLEKLIPSLCFDAQIQLLR